MGGGKVWFIVFCSDSNWLLNDFLLHLADLNTINCGTEKKESNEWNKIALLYDDL